MAEAYRLYTEAHYDATNKTTGVGQAQAWDSSSSLGGLAGDIKYTVIPGPIVDTSKTFAAIGSSYLRIRFYYDFSSFTVPNDTGYEFANVYSSTGYLTRLTMKVTSGAFKVRPIQYDDGRASNKLAVYDASSLGPDYIEMLYTRPTTNMTADGTVQYSTGLDGVIGTQTGIDNYDEFPTIEKFKFGAGLVAGSVGSGFSGSYWLGKLLITNDANPIGPISTYDPSAFNTLRRRRRL